MSKSEKFGTTLIQTAFCAMLALVPLAYQNGIYDYTIYDYTLLPKRLILYICTTLATLGWLIQSGWGRNFSWTTSPLLLPFFCFAGMAALSFSQTTHPLDALVELTNQAVLIGLFFMAACTLTSQNLKPLLWTNTLIGLGIALIGIAQYHNLAFVDLPTNGHPSATFGFRNFAAMYLICSLPLSALLFLNTTSVAGQILSCLSTTLMGVFLVYTRTRGAWFGFGIALCLVVGTLTAIPFLRTFWKKSISPLSRPPQIIFLALGLALFLGLTPLSPQFRDSGLQRFDEKKTDITSTVTSAFREGGDRGRLNMWRNTISLILDHPLLGVGPGGWKRAYPPYDRGAMIRKNSSPVRPHNDYLWIASEYGLPGLALYIWALGLAFVGLFNMARHANPVWKHAAPLFAISVLAILLHAGFSFPKEQPQAALYLYLLLGLIAGASSTGQRQHRFLGAMVLYFFLGLNLSATALTLHQVQFDRHYLGALLAEDRGDWPTVQSEIEKALHRGTFRSHGLVIWGRALEKTNHYEAAESAYQKVLGLAPYTWHAYNGLGVIYKKQGRFEEAQNAYQNALSFFPGSFTPDRVDIQNNLAAVYRSMGDTSRAESVYRSVLEAYPDNPGANNNLGNIFKFRGQLDSAIVAYQKAIQKDPTLVQAYFNLGNTLFSRSQFRKALAAYQSFLNRWTGDPKFTQFAKEQIKACQKQISPGSP